MKRALISSESKAIRQISHQKKSYTDGSKKKERVRESV